MNNNNIFKKYIFLNDDNNEIIQNIDISKNSLLEIINETTYHDYTLSTENKDIPDYIFKFYAYNEILASFREKNNGIVSKEDLNIFKEYGNFINDFSKKIFSFILYCSLTEARYSKILKRPGLHNYNLDYVKFLKSSYAEKCTEDLEKGVVDNLMKNYLYYIKNEIFENNNDNYEIFIKNSANIKDGFTDFLEKIYYHQIPNDFKIPFDQVYLKNNPYIMHNDLKKILNQEFTDINGIFNVEKMNRFYDFSSFVLELQERDLSGDNGLLQQDIIISNLIEKSSIKDIPIEEIFEFLSITFLNGFSNAGYYGGKPWSDIAKHALSFVRGEINTEIFIDQSLSMEHNNGNMFNKNFIFYEDVSFNFFSLFKNSEKDINCSFLKIKMNDVLLNLQNSSSVLSLKSFKDTTVQDVITGLENNKLLIKKINSNNIDKVKELFNTFKNITEEINSFDEMILLAEKVGHPISTLNYVNFLQLAISKRESDNYKIILENNLDLNYNISQVVCGDFSNLNTKDLGKKEKKFQLHNLNYNNSKALTKELVGGKSHGLITLINKGFNVPKAIVFDTETCLSYLDNKEYFNTKYAEIDKKISDYLIDDKKQPLLVSVRSGASVSMPGMMDSILNVGIDDKSYPNLCKNYSKKVIDQCVLSFITQFCKSKLNLNIDLPKSINKALKIFTDTLTHYNIPYNKDSLFPISKEAQIKLSVEAVFDSWNSPRAIAWRIEKNISHDLGTAATIQKMVFGNKNDKSLTCVIFSRDCITGKPDIMGEFLPQAQGEDLVSGKRTPLPISELKISNPKIYQEIEFIAKTLEEEQKAIQDIEITVEDGKVYVLQMRNAVISPEAQLALAKDMELNLLDVIQPKHLIGESKIDTNLEANYNGLVGSTGLISGIIVRNQEDIDKYKNEGKDLIFFSNQALPEHAPIMIATQGFVTEFGGATSHAAILARSMGKPCVVGIGKQHEEVLESGELVTINANEGKIWKGELNIVINQENAVTLANEILKNNKVNIKEDCKIENIEFKTWTTNLSSFNILANKKINKHKMFLNISQKAALILQKEYKNKISIV